MHNLLSVLPFIALTFFCWGIYGPLLHFGQEAMGADNQLSTLRPLICVGIAYFIIAVLFPLSALRSKGETGHWTMQGFLWSFAAGAVGAIGALGIILAFKFKGKPIFVMPLVFGLAPVVNTFVTMFMTRSFKQASSLFYVGVIVVAVGAAGVMFFKPSKPKTEPSNDTVAAAAESESAAKSAAKDAPKDTLTIAHYVLISLFIGLTALCWGSYGPVLHKGQAKMHGSKMRPLICVGLAYFVVAVVVPLVMMPAFPEPGGWFNFGTIWSLAAGAAGAIGALGVVYAFTFGGKPIYVMPLVFGGAPVVNTLTSTVADGSYGNVNPWFIVSLLLVICGAVTVLISSPRGASNAKPKPA